MRLTHASTNTTTLFEFPSDAWWSEPSTDVAVAPSVIPLEEFGRKSIPVSLFATEAWIREHNVGIGDHLAISGMFTPYRGSERDEPIVRFGRISLMPRERLRIPPRGGIPGMQLEAILAEASAWGGQSGSPVFVYFSIDRHLFAGDVLDTRIPNPRLLGLLHGHFTVEESVREKATTYVDAHVPLNSGIAIVVPAESILAVLNSPLALEHREAAKEILRDEGLID